MLKRAMKNLMQQQAASLRWREPRAILSVEVDALTIGRRRLSLIAKSQLCEQGKHAKERVRGTNTQDSSGNISFRTGRCYGVDIRRAHETIMSLSSAANFLNAGSLFRTLNNSPIRPRSRNSVIASERNS
mgnify:CR=1 FL=1